MAAQNFLNAAGSLRNKIRVVCIAAVFWAAGWLSSCRRDDDDGGCQNTYESLVDGGLQCGEPFEFEDPPGEPGLFGIKAVPYVNLDLAGVVRLDTVATVLVLFRGEEDELGLDLDVKVCHVEFPRVEIPGQPDPTYLDLVPEAYDALDPVPVGGWLSGSQTCDSIGTGTAVLVFGARLPDEGLGPLPTDPATQTCAGDTDLGCLYDLDGDGYVGATMITEHYPVLDIRRLEVAMRTAVSLEGLMVSQQRMVGSIQMQLDIQILGCHVWDPADSAERRCNREETRVVQAMRPTVSQLNHPESPFVAVRVPSDLTCQELREHAQDYFGH